MREICAEARHPMYTGMLAFVIGTPPLLGAWYGILGGLLFMLT